ncbi:MAG: YihY/virulence factor BrkB family protein [Methylococcaceae bacterium]|nr:YihY/virulence factor BrkB family protein [Methylococcaceae bacterium]
MPSFHHSIRTVLLRARERAAAALRFGYAVARAVNAGGIDYRAMSLVYTSLMALVPLLAVSFSMLKTFGGETYLEPFLLQSLEPLGDRAGAVAGRILEAVKHLKVGVLGFVGVVFLFYTSVSLLEKIEESFNHIWHVRASRSAIRRFSDYLSFTLLGPLVVFSAFGGMSALLDHPPRGSWLKGWFAPLSHGLHALLPDVFIVAAFSAAYLYIPNAKVKPRAALVGGIAAGIAWKLAGWAFAAFVAGSAQYSALYSSFAILALFMIWLYLSWVILLAGVQVAFFCQHPRYLRFPPGRMRLRGSLLERLGLAILVLIGQSFLRGDPPWSRHALAEHFDLPEDCIDEVLQIFTGNGLLVTTQPRRDGLLPARDLSAIAVAEIVSVLRLEAEREFAFEQEQAFPEPARRPIAEAESAVSALLGQRALRELCEAEPQASLRPSQPEAKNSAPMTP